MNRIMGNPTATPMKVPDWNQTDETKADYIKNKPEIVPKEYVDEKIAEVEPTIIKEETDVDVASIIMEDNHVYHTQMVLNKLNVAFPEGLDIGYLSTLYFFTPNKMLNDYTSFPENIKFKGDSVEDEKFIPEANMCYTIVFNYDGVNVIGYVSGVSLG